MSRRKKRQPITIGDGQSASYAALLLFLAGLALGMLAVYDSVNRGGGYVVYLAAGLICSCLGMALFASKKDEQEYLYTDRGGGVFEFGTLLTSRKAVPPSFGIRTLAKPSSLTSTALMHILHMLSSFPVALTSAF